MLYKDTVSPTSDTTFVDMGTTQAPKHNIVSASFAMTRGTPQPSNANLLEWHGFVPDMDDPGGTSMCTHYTTTPGHQHHEPCYQQRYGELYLSSYTLHAILGHLYDPYKFPNITGHLDPVMSDDSAIRLWGAQDQLLLVSTKWGVTIFAKYYSGLRVLMENSVCFDQSPLCYAFTSMALILLFSLVLLEAKAFLTKIQKQTRLPSLIHRTIWKYVTSRITFKSRFRDRTVGSYTVPVLTKDKTGPALSRYSEQDAQLLFSYYEQAVGLFSIDRQRIVPVCHIPAHVLLFVS